jgi:hypothetical protein
VTMTTKPDWAKALGAPEDTEAAVTTVDAAQERLPPPPGVDSPGPCPHPRASVPIPREARCHQPGSG